MGAFQGGGVAMLLEKDVAEACSKYQLVALTNPWSEIQLTHHSELRTPSHSCHRTPSPDPHRDPARRPPGLHQRVPGGRRHPQRLAARLRPAVGVLRHDLHREGGVVGLHRRPQHRRRGGGRGATLPMAVRATSAAPAPVTGKLSPDRTVTGRPLTTRGGGDASGPSKMQNTHTK